MRNYKKADSCYNSQIIYNMAIKITSWEASMRYNIDYTLLRD